MQGRKVWDDGPREVWVKPLADGSRAVIPFNRGNEECPLSVSGRTSASSRAGAPRCATAGRRRTSGALTGRYETKVGSHDVAMLKVTAKF